MVTLNLKLINCPITWIFLREIEILKSKGIKRRNKNDDYSLKDVWVCIDKMKKRVDREKKVKYSLEDWILNLVWECTSKGVNIENNQIFFKYFYIINFIKL